MTNNLNKLKFKGKMTLYLIIEEKSMRRKSIDVEDRDLKNELSGEALSDELIDLLAKSIALMMYRDGIGTGEINK